MQVPLVEWPAVTLDSWVVPHKVGSAPEQPFFTKV